MKSPVKEHGFLLILLIAGLLIYPLLSSVSLTAMLLIGQVLVLLIPVLYMAHKEGELKLRLSLSPCRGVDFIRAVGIILLLQPFLLVYGGIIESWIGNPLEEVLKQVATEPIWVGLLGLVLVPAIAEEFLFRGYMLSSYKKMKPAQGILLSALLFGLFHLNGFQFSYALILGVFLGMVTYKTGSIWPAIGMHLVNNAIGILPVYWANSQLSQRMTDWSVYLGTSGIGYGLLLAVFSLGLSIWAVLQWFPIPLHRGEDSSEDPWRGDGYLGAMIAMFLFFAFLAH